MTRFLLAAILFSATSLYAGTTEVIHTFKKVRATDQFWAEGVAIGDFNHDGKMDIVSGAYWYEGPDFKKRHEIYPANASFKRKKADGLEQTVPGYEGALGVNNAYSDCFLTFTYDFNGDGWMDVLVYGFPGKEAAWYENPKNRPGHWQRNSFAVRAATSDTQRRIGITRRRRGSSTPSRPKAITNASLTASARATLTGMAALISSKRTVGGSSRHRSPTIRSGSSTRSISRTRRRRCWFMTSTAMA